MKQHPTMIHPQYCYRSIGHVCLSLRLFAGFNSVSQVDLCVSVWLSGVCDLVLNDVLNSLKCRPVCSTWFGTYQGASAVLRSIYFTLVSLHNCHIGFAGATLQFNAIWPDWLIVELKVTGLFPIETLDFIPTSQSNYFVLSQFCLTF